MMSLAQRRLNDLSQRDFHQILEPRFVSAASPLKKDSESLSAEMFLKYCDSFFATLFLIRDAI